MQAGLLVSHGITELWAVEAVMEFQMRSTDKQTSEFEQGETFPPAQVHPDHFEAGSSENVDLSSDFLRLSESKCHPRPNRLVPSSIRASGDGISSASLFRTSSTSSA